ncbi:MAG: hypothetical protein HN904_05750 [Victivallales bacterium]|nr:hypothetical protein [Victivallales bacterium]
MLNYALPNDIRGEWIWLADDRERLESFVFFRREFTLYQTPASAELWVSAGTICHVYVNGRYLGFGPVPCVSDDADVAFFDVSFLLQTGVNVITLLGYSTQVARTGSRRRPGALWAQLNTDDQPAVWTDSSWLCREGECYQGGCPRASEARGFCESVDLRHYPFGWTETEFDAVDWRAPDFRQALGDAPGKLHLSHRAEWLLDPDEASTVLFRGEFSQQHALTNVSWGGLPEGRGAGVYVAETFIHSGEDTEIESYVFSDDPYVLMVNDERVKEQGILPLDPKADFACSRPRCFGQGEVVSPELVVMFRHGWNRVLLAQHVEPGSAGVTILFPGVSPADLLSLRKPEQQNLRGWSLCGPLRTPIQLVSPNLHLADAPKSPYVPFFRPSLDESVYLMSCEFSPGDYSLEEAQAPISLAEGEYVVFDFAAVSYGCPELEITGEEGDIVDVVCAEQVVAGQALSWAEGRRNTDTLVLGSTAGSVWRGVAPRGMRYMMAAVRRAAGKVKVHRWNVRRRKYRFDNAGDFSCGDQVLNDIWQTGCRTLTATTQGRFLDAPAKETTQYTTDAMIEAWAGYHVFGAYELGGLALAEFAQSQLETGAIPASCPSDYFMEMPDYSLMWAVWLQRHYMYSGDKKLLERMLPVLERLLARYRHLADPEKRLLADLQLRGGGYCFLDHGEIHREGAITGLNAIYCRALLAAAWLFEQVGIKRKGESLRREAAHVARVMRELSWLPEQGLFADCWTEGAPSDYMSWQTNVLAIYGGIARPEDYGAILERLFCDDEPYELLAHAETNNPFFQFFVLESAFALGHREWAVRLMRWYWGAMLQRGATTWWELFDPDGNPNEVPSYSLCHGYGVSPNAFLCAEVAGIRPARPGFTRAYFNPLPEVTPWVKCRIPTPYGHIEVEWRLDDGGQFVARINANYPLEVVPVLSPGIAETATIHAGDEVSILAERG